MQEPANRTEPKQGRGYWLIRVCKTPVLVLIRVLCVPMLAVMFALYSVAALITFVVGGKWERIFESLIKPFKD